MSDEFYYFLLVLPLFAAAINKAAASYAFLIIISSYLFDLFTVSLSNDFYFLFAAILDLVFIHLMPKLAIPFAVSCVLNALQFAFGSIYEITDNPVHYLIIIGLQFIYLLKIKSDDDGLGGLALYIESFNMRKFNIFSNKRGSVCKKP